MSMVADVQMLFLEALMIAGRLRGDEAGRSIHTAFRELFHTIVILLWA
jgi:hypothetical protein